MLFPTSYVLMVHTTHSHSAACTYFTQYKRWHTNNTFATTRTSQGRIHASSTNMFVKKWTANCRKKCITADTWQSNIGWTHRTLTTVRTLSVYSVQTLSVLCPYSVHTLSILCPDSVQTPYTDHLHNVLFQTKHIYIVPTVRHIYSAGYYSQFKTQHTYTTHMHIHNTHTHNT